MQPLQLQTRPVACRTGLTAVAVVLKLMYRSLELMLYSWAYLSPFLAVTVVPVLASKDPKKVHLTKTACTGFCFKTTIQVPKCSPIGANQSTSSVLVREDLL